MILDILKHGYKIPFVETPERAKFKNNKSAFQNFEFVQKQINDLSACGIITEIEGQPRVVNPLSVSINRAGKKRIILHLRYVNTHLYKKYIRFDDWRALKNYVCTLGYSYKFDLRTGYCHR